MQSLFLHIFQYPLHLIFPALWAHRVGFGLSISVLFSSHVTQRADLYAPGSMKPKQREKKGMVGPFQCQPLLRGFPQHMCPPRAWLPCLKNKLFCVATDLEVYHLEGSIRVYYRYLLMSPLLHYVVSSWEGELTTYLSLNVLSIAECLTQKSYLVSRLC